MKKILCSLLVLLMVALPIVAQENEGDGFYVFEGRVVAEIDGNEREIGELAFSDDYFFGFYDIYSISPDRRAVAFVAEEKGEFGMYVYVSGESVARVLPSTGGISWMSQPVWSSDSRFTAFSMSGRIWVYDLKSRDSWIAAEPFPEAEYLLDIDPFFSDDGETITFYRGDFIDFEFGGEPYRVDVSGSEPLPVFVEEPAYLTLDELIEYTMMADEPMQEFMPDYNLLDLKILHFIDDLHLHNYERLFLAFDPQYIEEQRYIMEAYEEGLTPEVFDMLFFNGAVMYEDYDHQISSLTDIREVVYFEYDGGEEQLRVIVSLSDGREVEFVILVDPTTHLFYGPLG